MTVASGIDPIQLRALVIAPVLDYLGLGGAAAEELLLGTAIQESASGRYLHQLGAGPAVGIDEMEPPTYDDLWANYIPSVPELAMKLRGLRLGVDLVPPVDEMAGNLYYAVAMARVLYRRVSAPLPPAGDIGKQAAYYKRWYNTPKGAATEAEYIAHWRAATAG